MNICRLATILCWALLITTYTTVPQSSTLSKKNNVHSLIIAAQKTITHTTSCAINNNGEGVVAATLIEDGDTVFDVGANKGDWSTYVLNHHHNLTLHVFEPIPEMCALLSKQFAQQATINNWALSDSNKTQNFYCYEENSLNSLYERSSVSWLTVKSVITVPTTTLYDFCRKREIFHINFLKIDTEGAEYAILAGAQPLIAAHAIDFIQFEYGGTYYDAGTTLRQVFDLLTTNNYFITRITPLGLMPIHTWTESLEDFSYANFLAIAPNYASHTVNLS